MNDISNIVLTAVFTGIGTAIGLGIYEVFIKDKLHIVGNKIKSKRIILDVHN